MVVPKPDPYPYHIYPTHLAAPTNVFMGMEVTPNSNLLDIRVSIDLRTMYNNITNFSITTALQ
jgi:hypothetical protein